MPIHSFFDLDSWKEGHGLVLDIYKITKSFPREEQFGITSQIRRAASSITANLAEGWARYHFKDRTRFYYQSRGSWGEVQNFLVLARDLEYINNSSFDEIFAKTVKVGQLINGLIRSAEKLSISSSYESRVTNNKSR
jgi:four helix bundle protein